VSDATTSAACSVTSRIAVNDGDDQAVPGAPGAHDVVEDGTQVVLDGQEVVEDGT
jgi:hypothetical protein